MGQSDEETKPQKCNVFLCSESSSHWSDRNEVRMANGELASWGNGKRNDWAQAAEKAGNLILGKRQKCIILQHWTSNKFC